MIVQIGGTAPRPCSRRSASSSSRSAAKPSHARSRYETAVLPCARCRRAARTPKAILRSRPLARRRHRRRGHRRRARAARGDRAGDRRRLSRSTRSRAAASSSSSTAARDWPEGAEERCRARRRDPARRGRLERPRRRAGHDARRQDGGLVAGDRQPHEARPLREHPAGALPARHEARHLRAVPRRCGARRRSTW